MDFSTQLNNMTLSPDDLLGFPEMVKEFCFLCEMEEKVLNHIAKYGIFRLHPDYLRIYYDVRIFLQKLRLKKQHLENQPNTRCVMRSKIICQERIDWTNELLRKLLIPPET